MKMYGYMDMIWLQCKDVQMDGWLDGVCRWMYRCVWMYRWINREYVYECKVVY